MTPEDDQYAKDHNLLPEPEEEPEVVAENIADVKYLEENAKKEGVVVLPSGLQYQVLAEGDGPSPKPQDRVRVHYRGTFVNGTEFDSSYSRGETAAFGVTQVIPGWTEALQLMKKGAKWRIAVPSELGYGKNAPPRIGPDRTLVFEVELIDIMPASPQ
jgi:FKBP-type peptidyl-prolyl cis-trans isomerase